MYSQRSVAVTMISVTSGIVVSGSRPTHSVISARFWAAFMSRSDAVTSSAEASYRSREARTGRR